MEILLIIFFYFSPALVALARKHNFGGVAIVNLLLGWTIIGWIIALVMACGAKPSVTACGAKPSVTVILREAHEHEQR